MIHNSASSLKRAGATRTYIWSTCPKRALDLAALKLWPWFVRQPELCKLINRRSTGSQGIVEKTRIFYSLRA